MSTDPEPTKTPAELKTLVENGYDAIAPKYLAWSGPRATATRQAYIERLATLLPTGARVLELGCGAGVPATQQLIAHGLAVTGVDISAAQIALAREHVPAATLIQADMSDVEKMDGLFAEGDFDAVVAFYSLFHLPRAEQGAMVARMARWVKPGGWLLFNLNTGDGDMMRPDWMGVPMFSSSFSVEGNRQMMKEHGQDLVIVEDDVTIETVGRMEEKFHWFLASKGEAVAA
ncbi:S-adenosyl-L-methionine-dependent methyltransferase [Athelia psychrophila]|uniref:S-adenosyl-L-methionine-dependent methyltransferase n=1 Tax=Athelia psychrophila TaxID=1759441 RepID=A0A166HQC1_9AGAM|nr:S-adenosyl-L-methionine-dependent methyltransferase [Fibularhizoctonia sp. CBS 109695]